MTAVIVFICRKTLFLILRIFLLRSIKSGSKEMADGTLLLACKSKAHALYLFVIRGDGPCTGQTPEKDIYRLHVSANIRNDM